MKAPMSVLIGYSTCPVSYAAFDRRGHVVATCDLRPATHGGVHLRCDIWTALRAHPWDMAILHPMCTYLTVSAAWAFADPDFGRYPDGGYHQRVRPGTLTGKARREARREALENFRRLLALPFPVAIENPGRSFLSTAIRPPDQLVHPYEFGDDASKLTGFWLVGLPSLAIDPARRCGGRWVEWPRGSGRMVERWANQTDGGQNALGPADDRWIERSATYPGIAEAMGETWG